MRADRRAAVAARPASRCYLPARALESRRLTARALILFALGFAAAGCDDRPPGNATREGPDSVLVTTDSILPPRSIPPFAGVPGGGASEAGSGQGTSGSSAAPPSAPYVDRGVCPFECCLYREWRTVRDLPVYSAERDSSAIAFTIAAGEPFAAVGGNVHLDEVGLALATDSLTVGFGPESTRLEAGDSVYVLSYRGEGTFNLWHEGKLFVGEGFWAMMPLGGREAAGRLVREPRPSWWVSVRDRAGREGWIDMNRHGDRATGADACG